MTPFPLSFSCQYLSCDHLFFLVISDSFKLDKGGWFKSHWTMQKHFLAHLVMWEFLSVFVGGDVFGFCLTLHGTEFFLLGDVTMCLQCLQHYCPPVSLRGLKGCLPVHQKKCRILQRFCCDLGKQIVVSTTKHKHTSEALCLIGQYWSNNNVEVLNSFSGCWDISRLI